MASQQLASYHLVFDGKRSNLFLGQAAIPLQGIVIVSCTAATLCQQFDDTPQG